MSSCYFAQRTHVYQVTYKIIPGYSAVVTRPACLSFYIRTYQYITSLKSLYYPPILDSLNQTICADVDQKQMQQEPSKWASGGINVSGEAPFEMRGFSLANAAALVGLASPSPWHRSSSTSPPAGLVASPGSGSCTASLSPSSGSPGGYDTSEYEV